jgi:Spy/CpxP family protein refolding chaperone
MALGKLFLSAALVFASGSLLIAADEPATPTTQPTEAKAAKPKRLTQPWSLLKTLTPEQVTQIEKIHADSSEQIKKVQAKETDDITALLTPEQVAELKVAEAKHKEETVLRRKAAATQP